MAKGKTFINSPATRRMMEEGAKKLVPLLGLMFDHGITSRKLIKMEFYIDYKTIAKLTKKNKLSSVQTFLKLNYVMAFYLDREKKALGKLKQWDEEKVNREKLLAYLMDEYKSFYGFQATYALDLIAEGYDLREIVAKK